MPDIFYLVSKWWKQMLAVVLLSLIIVFIVLALRPAKYLSIATALPSSSYATDKSSIFDKNIQLLYSALGTPDDLDYIVGTAQLDTVYIAVAEKLNLASHYKVEEQGTAAILKAAFILKKNTRVLKSDYTELKVKVWDDDKTMVPQLANAIMEKLSEIHRDLQNSNNVSILNQLLAGKGKIQSQPDSMVVGDRNIQLTEYITLISQYQLMVDSRPAVLIIVEKARAPQWPDKPKKLPILVATVVLSLLFTLLAILVIERKKIIKS